MSYTQYKVASFGPGKAGLSTVGYTVSGGSRITAGVAEIGTLTGVYGATVTFSNSFSGSILWDTGDSNKAYAAEDINPSDELAAIASAVLTTPMVESYNADGSPPTLAQAQFAQLQRLTEFAISGTSIVVKKLDGTTTAYTLTMDAVAGSATSSTRSS